MGSIRIMDQPGVVGGIDLNSLVQGGGSFSASGLNLGSGASGSGAVTPAPATTSSNTSSTANTSKTGTKQRTNKEVTQGVGITDFDKQNIDAQSLAILQNAIQQMAGGGEGTLLAALDAARGRATGATEARVNTLDPNAAAQRAGGRTADLARQLQEGAIASLIGSDEAGGFGGNALSQLLAQDAAIRTGEAQARVEEEAFNNAVAQQFQGTDILNRIISGGSAVQDQLLALLNTAKGAVEQGQQTTTTAQSTEGLENEVTSEQGTASSKEAVNTTAFDPLEWAKLAGTLSVSGAGGGGQLGGGPSAVEKALALFPALGGDSTTLLSSLTGTPGLYNTRGVGAQTQAQQSFNKLLQMLGG